MSGQGFYGFPNILGLLRGTNLKVLGKAGATAGAGLAGGTTSGAPTSGAFDQGEAVIGQDGTLFLCTVSGSPGTWVQLGTLVDPLTTRGDIIRRGASATQRLALGSANQVLQSDGTDVLWGAAPPGGGGALTQLAQTTLSGTAASITFSGIPGSYSNLQFTLMARTDQVATFTQVNAQFNADTSSIYDYQRVNAFGSSGTAGTFEGRAQTSILLGYVAGASATSSVPGSLRYDVINYAGTTFWKQILGQCLMTTSNAANDFNEYLVVGQWRSTAAITSIKVFPSSGNFVAGTVCTLYGCS